MRSSTSLWLDAEPLVLASGSRIRRQMLQAAGIPVEVVPAALDERAIERDVGREGTSAASVAEALATAKASSVAAMRPGRLVLGADQTLTLDGEALHKPATMAEAFDQLRRLSGRPHVLESAAAVVRGADLLGCVSSRATLHVRPLSDDAIRHYLAAAGEGILSCVGAYEVEAMGAHLFDAVEGDHFTIMGLPLLPVLHLLRAQDALQS